MPPSAFTATARRGSRTEALEGFKSGRYRVLVATDIAARGIDVEALGHVVNFDVPAVPDDYIHRVGRTARAEATGDAFTFVSPEEEPDLQAIEKAVGKRLPRVTLPGFDYSARADSLEVPLAQRIAAIRQRRAAERPRSHGGRSQGRGAGAAGAPGPRRAGTVLPDVNTRRIPSDIPRAPDTVARQGGGSGRGPGRGR